MAMSWYDLPQNLFENLNDIVSETNVSRFEDARDWINDENVGTCVDFYESTSTDEQKMLVMLIFASDRITPDTQKIATQYLVDVKELPPMPADGIPTMRHIACLRAVCQLEGSMDGFDTYYHDVDALIAARDRVQG